MLNPINLEEKLLQIRNRKIKRESEVITWVQKVFDEVDKNRISINNTLNTSDNISTNQFDIDKVDSNAIFHISQIKTICTNYRLRFLDTKYFKGEYPSEVISKINQLEQEHNTKLGGFKIVAPSVLFKLKKADDPILFAPMGNDYYYLIHKWGSDLHPLRKFKYWAVKNVGNLAFTIALVSFILTTLFHPIVFNNQSSTPYIILLFMFIFKGIVGFVLYFGISSGKNFSEYSWQSKYDKIC